MLFLHEQFHHKVESLGFRLLIATKGDRYRTYKQNVYRALYYSTDCLEESLANAESYVRLKEDRYRLRVRSAAIRAGVRKYLKRSFPLQPNGYGEAPKYLSDTAFQDGLYRLEGQVLEGMSSPLAPHGHWSMAPNMITALADITDRIYLVLPKGGRPIFDPGRVDPRHTASTEKLESALTKYYGYRHVAGGKGSHVKLKRANAPTIMLPGNRVTVSIGVVKDILRELFGGADIERLPDLLSGKLPWVLS